MSIYTGIYIIEAPGGEVRMARPSAWYSAGEREPAILNSFGESPIAPGVLLEGVDVTVMSCIEPWRRLFLLSGTTQSQDKRRAKGNLSVAIGQT